MFVSGLLRDGAENCDDHPGAAAVRPADGVAHSVSVGQDAVQRPAVAALRHASGEARTIINLLHVHVLGYIDIGHGDVILL